MTGKKKNYSHLFGSHIGRWTILDEDPITMKKHTYLKCGCSCGSVKMVRVDTLLRGQSKSCGCIVVESTRDRFRTHGMSKIPEYKVWISMRSRCNNPGDQAYENYGGRGISVCDRWRTFENFVEDMGRRPAKEYTLERVNNDLGYNPDNCVWATMKEQSRNKRTNVMFEFRGRAATIPEWAEITGLSKNMIYLRVHRLGWSIEQALTEPSTRSVDNEPSCF